MLSFIEFLREAKSSRNRAYIYVGPIDERTRDWCLSRVGRVFTRAQIDAMDNGQIPDPFTTGGGYNCRHKFVEVHKPGLIAMAGTSRRLPEYDRRVRQALYLRRQAA